MMFVILLPFFKFHLISLLCRFQILRDLIPHSDQKRDKASFLLEVSYFVQIILVSFSFIF